MIERFERRGCVEFVGILRCAQDEGKDLNDGRCIRKKQCKDEHRFFAALRMAISNLGSGKMKSRFLRSAAE